MFIAIVKLVLHCYIPTCSIQVPGQCVVKLGPVTNYRGTDLSVVLICIYLVMNEIEHIFKKLFVFPLLWTVCSHPLLIFPLSCWSSIFYNKNFIQGKFNLGNVNPLWYELQITFFFLSLVVCLFICTYCIHIICTYLCVRIHPQTYQFITTAIAMLWSGLS